MEREKRLKKNSKKNKRQDVGESKNKEKISRRFFFSFLSNKKEKGRGKGEVEKKLVRGNRKKKTKKEENVEKKQKREKNNTEINWKK